MEAAPANPSNPAPKVMILTKYGYIINKEEKIVANGQKKSERILQAAVAVIVHCTVIKNDISRIADPQPPVPPSELYS